MELILFIGHNTVPGKNSSPEKLGENPRFVAEKRDAANCGEKLRILLF
jgi:hypothetical protein